MDRLGHHAQQVDVLIGHHRNGVEQCILYLPAKDIAGHVLGGRHIFQRGIGEYLAYQLRVRQFPQEGVFLRRVDLERVAQTHQRDRHPRQRGKLLVDQLRGQNGMRGLVSIGGGEIIVLSGVDDDAGIGIDHPRKELIHKGALQVDVAEDDAVHRIVQHHIQPFQRAHRGDFGHAQPAAIIRQADVTAQLRAHLVQRGAHQAEVFLRGVSAAKAFRSGAIGHVIEQALPGRSDDRDDIGAGLGGVAGLGDVLIDIAGGDDEVEPRCAGRDGLGEQGIAGGDLSADLVTGRLRHGPRPRAGSGDVGGHRERQAPFGHSLAQLLDGQAVFAHRARHRQGCAMCQQALRRQMIHHPVGQWHIFRVHPV